MEYQDDRGGEDSEQRWDKLHGTGKKTTNFYVLKTKFPKSKSKKTEVKVKTSR